MSYLKKRKDNPEMDIYEINEIGSLLKGNTYPGRGIIIGKTPDGENAVAAYFIMGRSANSRNRIFVEKEGSIYTEPFDASKCTDPSLIIYAAVRQYQNKLIVTNGNQTDTIYDEIKAGGCFQCALKKRTYEPDAPNFTSRISGMVTLEKGGCNYKLNILKRFDTDTEACIRETFDYEPVAGVGHFLHTYMGNGEPLPRFQGEPEIVAMDFADIDDFTKQVWESLNADNKVSLVTRYVSLKDGSYTQRIVNRNK